MAPGDNGGGRLTWPAVKQLCTQADIDRLACLAVAFINNPGAAGNKIYEEAADQHGGNIKPASYKRGLWVISKKIKDAMNDGKVSSGSGSTPTSTPNGKGKGGKAGGGGGKKRKADTPVNDDGDEDMDDEEVERKKAKTGGKKDETPIKTEMNGDGDAFADDIFQ